MRHFRIFTRHAGRHDVEAETQRHAVAALVARLGLTESQTAQVVTWSVAEILNKDDPRWAECEVKRR